VETERSTFMAIDTRAREALGIEPPMCIWAYQPSI
jgi:hypothetical protein